MGSPEGSSEASEGASYGRGTGYTGVPVSVDPTINGELDHASLPATGPARAIELRRDLLPALPLPPALVLAGGGMLAGIVAVVTLRALRGRRILRRRRNDRKELVTRRVVGKRSFLVDVHLLGR